MVASTLLSGGGACGVAGAGRGGGLGAANFSPTQPMSLASLWAVSTSSCAASWVTPAASWLSLQRRFALSFFSGSVAMLF